MQLGAQASGASPPRLGILFVERLETVYGGMLRSLVVNMGNLAPGATRIVGCNCSSLRTTCWVASLIPCSAPWGARSVELGDGIVHGGGGNYAAPGVPFPSGFPAAVDAEIAAAK